MTRASRRRGRPSTRAAAPSRACLHHLRHLLDDLGRGLAHDRDAVGDVGLLAPAGSAAYLADSAAVGRLGDDERDRLRMLVAQEGGDLVGRRSRRNSNGLDLITSRGGSRICTRAASPTARSAPRGRSAGRPRRCSRAAIDDLDELVVHPSRPARARRRRLAPSRRSAARRARREVLEEAAAPSVPSETHRIAAFWRPGHAVGACPTRSSMRDLDRDLVRARSHDLVGRALDLLRRELVDGRSRARAGSSSARGLLCWISRSQLGSGRGIALAALQVRAHQEEQHQHRERQRRPSASARGLPSMPSGRPRPFPPRPAARRTSSRPRRTCRRGWGRARPCSRRPS